MDRETNSLTLGCDVLCSCHRQFPQLPSSSTLSPSPPIMAVELFATDFCPFAQRAWIAFLEKVSGKHEYKR